MLIKIFLRVKVNSDFVMFDLFDTYDELYLKLIHIH